MTDIEAWHKRYLARGERVYHIALRNQRLFLSGQIDLAEMARRHEELMVVALAAIQADL